MSADQPLPQWMLPWESRTVSEWRSWIAAITEGSSDAEFIVDEHAHPGLRVWHTMPFRWYPDQGTWWSVETLETFNPNGDAEYRVVGGGNGARLQRQEVLTMVPVQQIELTVDVIERALWSWLDASGVRDAARDAP